MDHSRTTHPVATPRSYNDRQLDETVAALVAGGVPTIPCQRPGCTHLAYRWSTSRGTYICGDPDCRAFSFTDVGEWWAWRQFP